MLEMSFYWCLNYLNSPKCYNNNVSEKENSIYIFFEMIFLEGKKGQEMAMSVPGTD